MKHKRKNSTSSPPKTRYTEVQNHGPDPPRTTTFQSEKKIKSLNKSLSQNQPNSFLSFADPPKKGKINTLNMTPTVWWFRNPKQPSGNGINYQHQLVFSPDFVGLQIVSSRQLHQVHPIREGDKVDDFLAIHILCKIMFHILQLIHLHVSRPLMILWYSMLIQSCRWWNWNNHVVYNRIKFKRLRWHLTNAPNGWKGGNVKKTQSVNVSKGTQGR